MILRLLLIRLDDRLRLLPRPRPPARRTSGRKNGRQIGQVTAAFLHLAVEREEHQPRQARLARLVHRVIRLHTDGVDEDAAAARATARRAGPGGGRCPPTCSAAARLRRPRPAERDTAACPDSRRTPWRLVGAFRSGTANSANSAATPSVEVIGDRPAFVLAGIAGFDQFLQLFRLGAFDGMAPSARSRSLEAQDGQETQIVGVSFFETEDSAHGEVIGVGDLVPTLTRRRQTGTVCRRRRDEETRT